MSVSDNHSNKLYLKRALIFSGGHLNEWALSQIRPNDLLIGADRGAAFLINHGYPVTMAIGDFDSVSPELFTQIKARSQYTEQCSPNGKDFTDTEMACDWALTQQVDEIGLFGVLGTRFDHSLANVHLLIKAMHHQMPCYIANEQNLIRLATPNTPVIVTNKGYKYVSLLPLSMHVLGLTLEGFKYPLHQATIEIGKTLTVSNELSQMEGSISFDKGLLLVIQTKDE